MVVRFLLWECNVLVHFTWKVTHSRRLWNVILASRLQVYERCSNLPPNVCYVLCQTLQINFQRAKHCIVVSTALFFLPDKFLLSSAAYVRRYIAWAMKVDVIMLTDFLNCWKQSRHKHVSLLSNLLLLAFTFGREETDDEFCQ